MLIKDLQTGTIRKYGTNCHDSLDISEDGRTLSYYNLQCGEGSKYGDFRFVMEDGKVPAESETADAMHGCSYFNIGGFNKTYKDGRISALDEFIAELEEIDECEFASFSLGMLKEFAEKIKGGGTDGNL